MRFNRERSVRVLQRHLTTIIIIVDKTPPRPPFSVDMISTVTNPLNLKDASSFGWCRIDTQFEYWIFLLEINKFFYGHTRTRRNLLKNVRIENLFVMTFNQNKDLISFQSLFLRALCSIPSNGNGQKSFDPYPHGHYTKNLLSYEV